MTKRVSFRRPSGSLSLSMTTPSPESSPPETATPEPSLSRMIQAALDRAPGRTPCLDDASRRIAFEDLAARTWIDAPAEALAGKNLLIVTYRPLNAALAMCSLDGLAARLVICPP